MLLCPVRECRMGLRRDQRRLVCPQGHSFDVARSGYSNLLQPQDRRSKHPGDTAQAVSARRRLHDAGVTQPLLEAISDLAAPSPSDLVLDAGCGEGFYLGSLGARTGLNGHGLDISIPAIDAAARRYPGCEWLVANGYKRLDAVERLSDLKQEPAWLRERRLAAWNLYEQMPTPTPQERAWKYTDITRLDFDQFSPFAASSTAADADLRLRGYVEEDRSPEELVAAGHSAETVARVVQLVDRSEYKRRQAPPGVKITPRAFGRDRRMPIVNRYSPSGTTRPAAGKVRSA